MSIFDIVRAIFGQFIRTGLRPIGPEPEPQPEEPKTDPTPPTPATPVEANRYGSFIIADVYPRDLDDPSTPQYELPPFHVLPGLKVMDKEVIGCYVKCSEGTGWGAKNEDWFKKCWRKMKEAGGERYGVDFFRGAYHFLRFSRSGAAQADYCLDLIESAGGWDKGDLMLWVDVEEGGQGTWAGGEKLEKITDPVKRKRLADEVTKCTSDFVARVKQRYPGMKVGIYGRGVFRDLRMTKCRFGADGVCNPAYTKTMPPMEQYGWPLEDIIEWQLCGDGYVVAKGFPSKLPGWGATDYSAVIYGSHRVSLADVRRRCLARPR